MEENLEGEKKKDKEVYPKDLGHESEEKKYAYRRGGYRG